MTPQKSGCGKKRHSTNSGNDVIRYGIEDNLTGPGNSGLAGGGDGCAWLFWFGAGAAVFFGAGVALEDFGEIAGQMVGSTPRRFRHLVQDNWD